MIVQLNTDHNIHGRESLAQEVENVVRNDIERFEKQITRIEIYLSDSNGPKGGPNDIRCLIEARLSGLRPIVASHEAEELMMAVNGASAKLERMLESTLGELGRRKAGNSDWQNSTPQP